MEVNEQKIVLNVDTTPLDTITRFRLFRHKKQVTETQVC